jgi:hypothetical protein
MLIVLFKFWWKIQGSPFIQFCTKMIKKNKMMVILYLSLLLLGMLSLGAAVKLFRQTTFFLDSGIVAEAKVIQLEEVESGDGPAFKPIFEVRNAANVVKLFESKILANPPDYTVGEKVTLIYSPMVNQDFRIKSFWGLYGWSIGLLAFALPLIVIGGGYFLYLGTQG